MKNNKKGAFTIIGTTLILIIGIVSCLYIDANHKLQVAQKSLDEKGKRIVYLEKSDEELSYLTRYTHDNLFIGNWKILSVFYKGRTVGEETATKMLLDYQKNTLNINKLGFSFLGIDYEQFNYRSFFVNYKKQAIFFDCYIPFQIKNEKTDYIYYAELIGYKNGTRSYVGDIIIEDENTAYLSCRAPGDAVIYFEMERIAED